MIRVAPGAAIAETPFIPENFKNPAWDEKKDLSAILDCMRKGDLIYTCEMRTFLERRHKTATFNNEVHYGILKQENFHVAVVYKPKEASDVSAAYAEKVAYDIYETVIAPHTGHHFIPPTVVRTMSDGRVASCQFFVETDDEEDMWNPAFREKVFKTLPHEVVQEIAVFVSVFNDWDRHPGNDLATWREDRFHLALIDNESIENRGWLPGWGERTYVPVFFTEDPRANIQKELHLSKEITLPDFKSLLADHGFKEVPRMRVIFNNLVNRGDGKRVCLISNNALLVCFHQGNEKAFPLPKGPYPQALIEIYRRLNKESLDACFQPLVKLDPERFSTRVSDILLRRDMFLSAASSVAPESSKT